MIVQCVIKYYIISFHPHVLEVFLALYHVDGDCSVHIRFSKPLIWGDLMIGLDACPHKAGWGLVISKEASDTRHVSLSEGGGERTLIEDDNIILEISNDKLVL